MSLGDGKANAADPGTMTAAHAAALVSKRIG